MEKVLWNFLQKDATVQETVLSTKVPIISRLTPQDQRVINNRITRKTSSSVIEIERFEQDDDPLAQSFFVEEDNGIFLTSVDLFFLTKSSSLPVDLRIVGLENGYLKICI